MSVGTIGVNEVQTSEKLFATFQTAGIWSLSGSSARESTLTAERPKQDSHKRNRPRVARRLKGFLIGFEGEWAKVVYVEKNRSYQYSVPAKQLIKNGIKIENQPFEMDEVEITIDHEVILGTVFRPLATAESAKIEPLILSEEEKAERAEILGYFADAKA